MTNNTDTKTEGRCTCNEPDTEYHSGVPECRYCWNWRKLNGPAAQHWARVSKEFLSNVDMHDYLTYSGLCGLTREEFTLMLEYAGKMLEGSERMIQEHRERRN